MFQYTTEEQLAAAMEQAHAYRELLNRFEDEANETRTQLFLRDITIFALQYPDMFKRIQENQVMREVFPELAWFDQTPEPPKNLT